MNGKGDSPRSCFSEQFKNNYDAIEGFTFKPSWQKRKMISSGWLSNDEFKHVIILSPDGWDSQHDFLHTELTYEEFTWKLIRSKITNK